MIVRRLVLGDSLAHFPGVAPDGLADGFEILLLCFEDRASEFIHAVVGCGKARELTAAEFLFVGRP